MASGCRGSDPGGHAIGKLKVVSHSSLLGSLPSPSRGAWFVVMPFWIGGYSVAHGMTTFHDHCLKHLNDFKFQKFNLIHSKFQKLIVLNFWILLHWGYQKFFNLNNCSMIKHTLHNYFVWWLPSHDDKLNACVACPPPHNFKTRTDIQFWSHFPIWQKPWHFEVAFNFQICW